MIIQKYNTYLKVDKLINILKNLTLLNVRKNDILNKEKEINKSENKDRNNVIKIYKTIDSMIVQHVNKIQFFNSEIYKSKTYNCYINLESNEHFYIDISSTDYIGVIDNKFKINTYVTPFKINNVIIKPYHVLLENELQNYYMLLNKNNKYYLDNFIYIDLLDWTLLYNITCKICYFASNEGKIVTINLKNNDKLEKIILLIKKYGNIINLFKNFVFLIKNNLINI